MTIKFVEENHSDVRRNTDIGRLVWGWKLLNVSLEYDGAKFSLSEIVVFPCLSKMVFFPRLSFTRSPLKDSDKFIWVVKLDELNYKSLMTLTSFSHFRVTTSHTLSEKACFDLENFQPVSMEVKKNSHGNL